jgi:hypothetical protein
MAHEQPAPAREPAGYGLEIVESVPLTLEEAEAPTPPPSPPAATGKVLRLR